MDERASGNRRVPGTGVPTDPPGATPREGEEKDHFLQLMFFQAHHRIEAPYGHEQPNRTSWDYAPLRHSRAAPDERYTLPLPATSPRVQADSPAIEVMTDLRRVRAMNVGPYTSIDDANQAMITHGVRALFVADEARQALGIVTSADILGERPIQFAQERGIRRGEVVVRDIMTPADRLEILDLREVERARVGDVVATLRVAGRQHALAVAAIQGAAIGQKTVCGIFSLTQIARQLGIAPQQVHDIARTFAEIEAVIATRSKP
jgi:CBS domain